MESNLAYTYPKIALRSTIVIAILTAIILLSRSGIYTHNDRRGLERKPYDPASIHSVNVEIMHGAANLAQSEQEQIDDGILNGCE